MADVVGRAPFAEKPFAYLGIRRELGVQHLDRPALAVAVRARVDRGHAADAEQVIEPQFLPQDETHALLRGCTREAVVMGISASAEDRSRRDSARSAWRARARHRPKW
jgi:hypothetical protein